MARRCSICGLEQPLTKFSKNGITKSGALVYRASCKACESNRLAVIRNDPSYKLKESMARKKRNDSAKEIVKYESSLTYQIRCSSCGKVFTVTTLPEKPGSITIICNPCSVGNNIKGELEDADY